MPGGHPGSGRSGLRSRDGQSERAQQRLRNRRYSRVRAIAEHPFLVVKHLWRHGKVRYRGIAKNLAQMYALFGFANLYRVRKQLLPT